MARHWRVLRFVDRVMRASNRSDLPPWLQPVTERLSPVVRSLIIGQTIIYLAIIFAPPLLSFTANQLAVGPEMFPGKPWQAVTSLFVHLHPISFVFDLLGLWFVGAAIERAVGPRRFWLLFLVPAVVANLVEGALIFVMHRPDISAGCGNAILAMFVVFGRQYGRTPVRVLGGLAVEAQRMALFWVGFSFVMALIQQAWPMAASTVVASALAYVMAGGRGAGISTLFAGMRRKRQRQRFDVLDGGRGRKSGTRIVN